MSNIREIIETLYTRSTGESISEELQKALSAQAFGTALPDGLEDSLLGGLYNVESASNDPTIAGKIKGGMWGSLDKTLKPVLVEHFGWTEQQYNEKRKEKTGNTLDMTLEFIRGYEESVNKRLATAIEKREGHNEKELREAIQAEFKEKLEGSAKTNHELQQSYSDLQNQYEDFQTKTKAEILDRDLSMFIRYELDKYKIKDDLKKDLGGGVSTWGLLKPTIMQKIKGGFAWVPQDDGQFKPMQKDDPTMEPFDAKKNKMGAGEIFGSLLAPHLATSTKPPAGGSGGVTKPKLNPGNRSGGNGGGNGSEIVYGSKVGEPKRSKWR